jgi:hypothetical protein
LSATVDRLREQIADIPLLDQHCHAPHRLSGPLDAAGLRAPFTESSYRETQIEHVPQTVGYRAMIRWLAALIGCDPTEQAVLQARAEIAPERYHRLLADDAVLGPLYADYLFAQAHSYSTDEWSQLTGRPVRELLRIETMAERLLRAVDSWDAFRHEFTSALAASTSRDVVGFKSIAAYRTGLDIQRVDGGAASRAVDLVRHELEERGSVRLAFKPLVDALIWETLEVAAELNLPIQFHVALGDDDVYLPTSNPTLLRAIFQEPRYRHVPIVLLHNYPYIREAAYLASIYPNAYLDLGLTFSLASSNCAALLGEALGLAPASKILASTDGHSVPEFQWFATRLWRWALPAALGEIVDADLLNLAEAVEIAAMVLHANSEAIYPQQSGDTPRGAEG